MAATSFTITAARAPGLTEAEIDRRLGRVYARLCSLSDQQAGETADGERVSEAQSPSTASATVSQTAQPDYTTA